MTSLEKVAELEHQLSVECEMNRLLTAELDELKRRHREQINAVNKFVTLAEKGCTIERNSVLGQQPWTVLDIDGEVVEQGFTPLDAAYSAVYKLETGETMPDMTI